MTSGAMRVACVLRAVNVGGRNVVPMAALRHALADAGLSEVTTKLASGNLLVTSAASDAALRSLVERVISEHFGVTTVAMVLHPHEIAAVLMDPASELGSLSPSKQVIITMDHEPPHELVDQHGLDTIAPGSACLLGRFVVQRCPDGISNAPALVPFIEARWGVVATARNRRTMDALSEALT